MGMNDDSGISNSERAFILQALGEEKRIDGRGLYEYRPIHFEFAPDDSGVTLTMGDTRVMTVVTAALEPPFPDRPNEGSLRINVELSPMASPNFEAGRPGEAAMEVTRLVERALRDSRAVDLEALCVLAGQKVWAVRADVHVLDHCGNVADACVLSALAGLLAFRRPDVTVGGGGYGVQVTVHPRSQREPVPLSIHHLPIAVSLALFKDGDLLMLDPGLKEEAARGGALTVVANAHKELCAVHKADGIGLSLAQVMRCVRIATARVEELTAQLRAALKGQEVARLAARVRRHGGAAGAAPASVGSIPVPTGAANPEAMETAEDAALLATSSSEGDDNADDAGDDDTATAREDALRAAVEVSTLQLAPAEPSGVDDNEDSRAAVLQRSGAAKPKRKDGGRNAAKKQANQAADHGSGQGNNTRTETSIRKKPKRTPASVTAS